MTQHSANALARTVERGARAVVEFATLPADGPNGAFFNEEDALPG